MNTLTPLESLFEQADGYDVPLPPALSTLYGRLTFPLDLSRPSVMGNFVTTLDGVVSLNEQGHTGGGDISGFNEHDQLVMGLLRAVADAVVVGAGTLRADPQHRWTASYIYPPLAEVYQQVRSSLGKSASPLNVIVTEHGNVNLNAPVFQSGEVSVLLITTMRGAERIEVQHLPPNVKIQAIQHSGSVNARTIVEAVVNHTCQDAMILVEGGPQLLGDFLADNALDELFLTLAPHIAGRKKGIERPGLVTGKRFAPEHPLWGTLVGVKRGGSHLFLRYAFNK